MYTACYSYSSTCSSGTEEDYSELHQLLEDMSSYMRDFRAIGAVQVEEREALLLKAELDKQKAEEMRYAAMEGMSSGLLFVYALICVQFVMYALPIFNFDWFRLTERKQNSAMSSKFSNPCGESDDEGEERDTEIEDVEEAEEEESR